MTDGPHDSLSLSETLIGRRSFAEAIDVCRAALEKAPGDARLLTNLGRAQCGLGLFAESIASCEGALAIDPLRVDARVELANACEGLGLTGRALAYLDAALRIDPASSLAHCFRATLLLWHGDFARGLPEQEWHWVDERRTLSGRFGDERWWDGSAGAGRVLAVHGQGRGDLIQMARYFPMIRERVSHLTLEVPADLATLLRGSDGLDDLVVAGTPVDTARYDRYVRLMTLPRLFGTEPSTVPGKVPYVRAPAGLAAAWRERFGRRDALRVGLVWAGNPLHRNDWRRSVPPGALAPLAGVRGVRWFALQTGPAGVAGLPHGLDAISLGPALTSFAETAAVLAQLDLLVSVDTAAAHLAGALGLPVWLLLPRWPDWRWRLEGSRTPWYPTMRLIRQTSRDDWEAPIWEVRNGLAELAAGRQPFSSTRKLTPESGGW